jgi:signal transduction histidine kinase
MVLADKETAEHLDTISEEVLRAEKIVHDLLSLAHTPTPNGQAVPIAEIVDAALRRQPPPEGISTSIDLAAGLPHVYVDAQHVEMVLQNLMLNAYQAMQDGGQFAVRARLADQAVFVSVADTGCGIPPEHMDRLFEPLFTTKSKGIGLGMTLSRNLIEANGGTIEVESAVNQGSTFTVVLPIEETRL